MKSILLLQVILVVLSSQLYYVQCGIHCALRGFEMETPDRSAMDHSMHHGAPNHQPTSAPLTKHEEPWCLPTLDPDPALITKPSSALASLTTAVALVLEQPLGMSTPKTVDTAIWLYHGGVPPVCVSPPLRI